MLLLVNQQQHVGKPTTTCCCWYILQPTPPTPTHQGIPWNVEGFPLSWCVVFPSITCKDNITLGKTTHQERGKPSTFQGIPWCVGVGGVGCNIYQQQHVGKPTTTCCCYVVVGLPTTTCCWFTNMLLSVYQQQHVVVGLPTVNRQQHVGKPTTCCCW